MLPTCKPKLYFTSPCICYPLIICATLTSAGAAYSLKAKHLHCRTQAVVQPTSYDRFIHLVSGEEFIFVKKFKWGFTAFYFLHEPTLHILLLSVAILLAFANGHIDEVVYGFRASCFSFGSFYHFHFDSKLLNPVFLWLSFYQLNPFSSTC